ncbi:MAG TPA: hypothetical protein VGS96_09825 [Thermoanaerobaculia bacterium]|jgi:hypothetical protein|nr:hypothetical protein [Thermoanaerobaculia bacterium]
MDPDAIRRSWEQVKARELVMRAAKEAVPDVPEWNWKHKIVDESGSEERFHARVETYDARRMSRISHHFWWLVHNCVAHPLIGVAPLKSFFDFHDWTSKKINGED